MKEVTGLEPVMWGPSMVGFGDYHYKYASGHEGDCFLAGFSPRKGQFSLYFMAGLDRFASQLKKLGKCKTGKGCLYVKKLEDIDLEVLREMIGGNVEALKEIYAQAAAKAAAKKKQPKKTGRKP